MALDMGAGAGGAQMLQDVLTRKRLEQQALREAQNMVAQRELQARGQDVQIAGQDAAQRRFDTTRNDQIAAAAAEQQAAQQAAGQQEAFEQTLPEHLRAAYHAAGHKSTFKPEDFVNAPETRDQVAARLLKTKQGESDIVEGRERRLVGAREGSAARLAKIKGVPVAGATPAQTPQQANEVADTLALIDEIEKDPSLSHAVGPMDQYAGGIINADPSGVNRFKSLHDQLTGKLSLAQAGKLKGQGQISDKERAMLNAAATALTRGRNEGDYKTELGKIRAQFERMQGGGGQVVQNGAPNLAAAQEFDYVPGKGLVPRTK